MFNIIAVLFCLNVSVLNRLIKVLKAETLDTRSDNG